MELRTQQSLSGFIATDPRLTHTETGDARLHARIGQEHWHHNDDGTWARDPTTFHDLVIYRRTAEHAFRQLRKGDHVIAEGYVHTYTTTDHDGQQTEREEFVARRIGHDTTRTRYTINRTPHTTPTSPATTPNTAPTDPTATPTTPPPAPAGLGL
jgi:single-stranded DNA-binding protein